MAQGNHPFPSRTRKLSPAAPMVLPLDGGRVGRCQAFFCPKFLPFLGRFAAEQCVGSARRRFRGNAGPSMSSAASSASLNWSTALSYCPDSTNRSTTPRTVPFPSTEGRPIRSSAGHSYNLLHELHSQRTPPKTRCQRWVAAVTARSARSRPPPTPGGPGVSAETSVIGS